MGTGSKLLRGVRGTSRRGDHRGPATGLTNHQSTSPGAMTAKESREVRHERSRATSRQRDGAALALVLGCRRITDRLRRYDQTNSLEESVIDIACLTPISVTAPYSHMPIDPYFHSLLGGATDFSKACLLSSDFAPPFGGSEVVSMLGRATSMS